MRSLASEEVFLGDGRRSVRVMHTYVSTTTINTIVSTATADAEYIYIYIFIYQVLIVDSKGNSVWPKQKS